jgi:DNA-binding transcriptional LysR family regulator
MRNLSIRQLQAIREIGRIGRINRVAEMLGLTAPAVTLQLRHAELELGGALFDRTRRGMLPTELGAVAIAAAEDILERMHILDIEADELVAGRSGRIRLGAVSTAKYFVPSLIAAFVRRNPGIEVRLSVGNRAETIEKIRHNELDLIIMGRPPRSLAVEASAMGDHPFVMIAPPDHPLAGERQISKERLAKEALLLREQGSGTRASLEMYFADLPERPDNQGIEMGSNESIKQAVMAGLGIAMLSAHTIAAEVKEGWLAVLDAEGLPIIRQWFCVTSTNPRLSTAAIALRTFLTGDGAGMLPRIG